MTIGKLNIGLVCSSDKFRLLSVWIPEYFMEVSVDLLTGIEVSPFNVDFQVSY